MWVAVCWREGSFYPPNFSLIGMVNINIVFEYFDSQHSFTKISEDWIKIFLMWNLIYFIIINKIAFTLLRRWSFMWSSVFMHHSCHCYNCCLCQGYSSVRKSDSLLTLYLTEPWTLLHAFVVKSTCCNLLKLCSFLHLFGSSKFMEHLSGIG